MKIRCTDDQYLSTAPDGSEGLLNRGTGKSFDLLSPAEHLKEARYALEDGYAMNADPMKTVWGRLNDARRHLMAISPDSSQYVAAKGLADEVAVRKRQMQDACAKAVRRYMARQREALATELEQYFVNKGMYVEIELNGIDKASLRISSSVLRAISISRIADETAFFSHLKRVGFKSVVFENSQGELKTYKLESC